MLNGLLRFAAVAALFACTLRAQEVRVRAVDEVSMPKAPDCNSPSFWRDGRLFLYGSHGSPWLSTGPDQFGPWDTRSVTVPSPDIAPKWMEAVWPDSDGVIWGWYHAEPVNVLPDSTLTAPKVGAAVSFDGGYTMSDLGFILESGDPIDPNAQNGYFVGGNGDCSAVLDRQKKWFYFFFGNYGGSTETQGVCLARMAFEDRANPNGKVWKYYNGAWQEPGRGGRVTPIFPVRRSWSSRFPDAFWGPSVHWNTYLNCYVMLLNRAAGANWAQEGVYVSFCPDLSKPETWTEPRRILERGVDFTDPGDYYPQVMGLESGGTDRRAGETARLYLHGVSKWEIDFVAPETAPTNVTVTVTPAAGSVAVGETASFAVTAMGLPPFTYQWQKDGVSIPQATEATYAISAARLADAGNYSVVVKNSLGATASSNATLAVTVPATTTPPVTTPTPQTASYLSNLSVSSALATENSALTVGFTLQGSEAKTLVLRAVGPSLALFGVQGAVADPRLQLFDATGAKTVENDDWLESDAAKFAATGAFPLTPGSADAALVTAVPSGPGTARATATTAGLVLVEIYDPAPSARSKIVNLSTRALIGGETLALVGGFNVSGTGSKKLLIRALGPQLETFGVTNALKDPVLEVYQNGAIKIAANDDWDSGLASVFAKAGAAAWPVGSRDAAVVLTLPAGNSFTAVVRSSDGSSGEAVLEIYELP